jgi:uncharacterized membrane protein YoaK (UPF0700 family)
MQQTDYLSELRRLPKLPVLLGAVAGYVDSCTFLGLFGLFVAQVTGSFVVTGAQIVAHDPGFLIKVLGIPFFLLGGIVTTLVAAAAEARASSALFWTFALEAILLAAFLIVGAAAAPFRDPSGTVELIGAFFGLTAMGVQSATVRLLMQGTASTNVMTTNTTLIAIETTRMMLAWERARRAPHNGESAAHFADKRRAASALVSIALGFLTGTLLGASIFHVVQFWSLLLPAAVLGSLSAWALIESRRRMTSPA